MKIATHSLAFAAWAARYLWSGWAGAAGLFCLAAVWQAGHEIYGSFVLPSPLETLYAVGSISRESGFAKAASETASRSLAGFALAVTFGSAAGILAGFSFAAMRLTRPIVTVILGVPPIAWIVLALIWFGSNGGSAVLTVIVAALPISFAGGQQGVATRDRALDMMARSFGAGAWMRFRTITTPHLVSYLFPAWTTTAGTAWKVTVMAELLSNSGGIGGELATARALFDIPRVMALIAVTVAFALFTEYMLLNPIRDRLENWREAGLPWGIKR
ncbi:ABC transporter permease [Bradyrhizobium sp. G127]|uniref:ABC transporter permease n=1 Tax=Bradyrhizobium sp. G127 TaxID=2904800 RepID=UPI001F238D0E|nr:ABC transporter permease [Bradyrhizobium sp. G127]